jgi:hypothetical protein
MATSAERLKQYEDLFEKSQAYDPAKFQQDFERAYGEATNYNQDLINQQSEALGNLQSVAPELRQRYSQTLIKDPTLQRSLIAQARQAPITDYSNAVNLLGQRGQRYADILGSSLSGYQTAAQRAQTAAENAWRLYQDQLAQEQAAKARAAALAQQQQQKSLADVIREAQEQQRIADLQRQNAQWNAGADAAWANQGATQTGDASYWDTLTKAANWEPENKTLANAYNWFTDNVGGFFYKNPTPYHAIANLFKRKK